jgi:transposase
MSRFVPPLKKDWPAVDAVEPVWSNVPMEGHISRLKAIKLQMYGRVGFKLIDQERYLWRVSHNLDRNCGKAK